MDLPKHGSDMHPDLEIECLECGIRLLEDEVVEVGGEKYCELCAEDHLDDDDLSNRPASVEEPPQVRSWHYH